MTNNEIVAKLWNLCNVLRDDGITYHQYVTELTYILFLKMAKETDTEAGIPEAYRWDVLKSKDGLELKKFYEELLRTLGEDCTGRIQEIYNGALILKSQQTLRRLSLILMALTGIQQKKKVLEISMKDYWRRMLTRKSLVLVSTLHQESLLM